MAMKLPTCIQRNLTLIMIAASSLCLALYPATICFDCEPDYTFGRPASRNDLGWEILAFWLLAAPLGAGLFRLRFAWVLPVCVAIADIATQHLGGVPLWDLRANEGPVILALTLIAGYTSLALGALFRLAYDAVRKRWST